MHSTEQQLKHRSLVKSHSLLHNLRRHRQHCSDKEAPNYKVKEGKGSSQDAETKNKQSQCSTERERRPMTRAAQALAVKQNLTDHGEGRSLPSGSPLEWFLAFTLIKLISPNLHYQKYKDNILPQSKKLGSQGKKCRCG